jgi:glycosyltransferase involved in cell wall biosynthesis
LSPSSPSVLYVVDDKTGGVLSLNSNLIRFRHPDELTHNVLLLHNRFGVDTRWQRPLGGDHESTFEYSLPVENVHAVLRRLREEVGDGDGVLVANDWLELALATAYDLRKAVILLVHDDYGVELALRHDIVADAIVCHGRVFYDQLCEALPHRAESIHHLPYGIPIPGAKRRPHPGALRLLFLGRMTAAKGIFDLPEIDRMLDDAGVSVQWTLVGDGPDRKELFERWTRRAPMRHLVPDSNEEVLALAAEHDVFVLPTRFEGFPVSLLEAMATGLVPVVSFLPGGIAEVISEGVTGYHPAVGHAEGFAEAIIKLDRDRDGLDTMSARCRQLVVEHYDIRERVKGYQRLFACWREIRRDRPAELPLPYGSRLDKPWIPNALVKLLRFGSRRLRGQVAVW